MQKTNVPRQPKLTSTQQRAMRQKNVAIKMSGFCDIVKEAGAVAATTKGKGKPSSTVVKPISKTTTKSLSNTTTTTTTTTTTMTTTTTLAKAKTKTTKNAERWEDFREKRLAEMKQHKINVERRMQCSSNLDGQLYWNQRHDKLKRYPKYETLHPTWYTENIYSNNSIDLEISDEYYGNADRFDSSNYGNNDYERDLFHRQKTHAAHHDGGYQYPKSQSCCFGSGYDERPKPILIPKSSSFTTSRDVNNFRPIEEERFIRREKRLANNDRRGLRKFYCWENDRQPDDEYCGKNAEVYHIDRDRYKKPSAGNNPNYIRNVWQYRNAGPTHYKGNINEINGNYLDDYNHVTYLKRRPDNRLPFDEDYLIVHQQKPNVNLYSARNSFDEDPLSASRRQSYHSNDLYTSDIDLYNDRMYGLNRVHASDRQNIKSKSMLEVKPPNRYDDSSSSDSTMDDLYDFNFDFANQYDMDYRNNNGGAKNFIEKNINVDNYAKYQKNAMDLADDLNGLSSDNELNDIDIDLDNGQSDDDFDMATDNLYNFNSDITHNFKNQLFNGLASPRHERSRYRAQPSRYMEPQYSDNDYARNARERMYDNDYYSPEPECELTNGSIMSNNNHQYQYGNAISDGKIINNNNNININNNLDNSRCGPIQDTAASINLIDNIFSIYKPRKYSPVNCRPTNKHATSTTKCMNVPSTVRPLGAPCNDFLTSMKRPLTIAPSCFTAQKRSWPIQPSASVDQAHFKIIPEKTGLKISPLYRFGYEDDSRLRLKCTARPLLFPL